MPALVVAAVERRSRIVAGELSIGLVTVMFEGLALFDGRCDAAAHKY